ncbi:MAG: class I tRNA ligase family protein, partial [Clostridia bacterium]|nr:class I tRNA ligase family protein [Clostridia bacterium]
KLTLMDKWALSKLNTLIKTVDEGLKEYKIFETARSIQDYVDELSNWYVRRGRERYWGSGMTEDKAAAYTTLYTVLVELSKVIAPYVPFMAESIYQNLVPAFYPDAPESVHLCDFPTADESYIDKKLEEGMNDVLEIVALGRAARNGSNIKNRQPLSKLYVAANKKVELSEGLYEIAKDELNIKEFELLDDASRFVTYKLKPQLKTLGPKYGAKLGAIREFLNTCDASEVVATVKAGRAYTVTLGGAEIEFSMDDLLISSEPAEGYVSESADGFSVVLDAHVTPELLVEGVERELVSRIQNMRKEAGFEVTDRIKLGFNAEGTAQKVLKENAASLGADVLAESVEEEIYSDGYKKDFDINGEKVTLCVKKVL